VSKKTSGNSELLLGNECSGSTVKNTRKGGSISPSKTSDRGRGKGREKGRGRLNREKGEEYPDGENRKQIETKMLELERGLLS